MIRAATAYVLFTTIGVVPAHGASLQKHLLPELMNYILELLESSPFHILSFMLRSVSSQLLKTSDVRAHSRDCITLFILLLVLPADVPPKCTRRLS